MGPLLSFEKARLTIKSIWKFEANLVDETGNLALVQLDAIVTDVVANLAKSITGSEKILHGTSENPKIAKPLFLDEINVKGSMLKTKGDCIPPISVKGKKRFSTTGFFPVTAAIS